MDKYEALEKAMCKELDALNQKLMGGAEMTIQELDKADKLAHALKSLATYKAMKEAEEYGMEDHMSGRRNPHTGRYMDAGPAYRYYPDWPDRRGW